MLRNLGLAGLLCLVAIGNAPSLAGASSSTNSGLDLSSEPPGVLPKAAQQKLWDAYKTAKECFKHPTYGPGTSQSLTTLKAQDFNDRPWVSPFTAVRGAAECEMSAPGNLAIPAPIPTVKLDEAYGERQQDVDGAAIWFRRLTTYHRLSGDPIALQQIKQGLLDWAKAKGLSKGIHVSWGNRPVDYQMMATILSFVAAAAEVAESFTPDERAIVGPWLNDLVKQAAASHWKDREDNKAYMRTYIALVWGLMVGDDKSVQDAVFAYKLAIHDMRPDGSWPIDSQRGAMGLHYDSATTSQIVMIAIALKEARGIDLFSYQVDGRSLHNAVDWIVGAMKDPGGVNRIYAIPCPEGGDRFGTIERPVTGQFDEAGYLLAYAMRFPERDSGKFILDRYRGKSAIDSEKNAGAAACHFALKGRDVALAPLTAPKPPPTLPKPTYIVATHEEIAHDSGDAVNVNSLFVSTVKDNKGGPTELDFNIRGNYAVAAGTLTNLSFVLNEPLGKVAPSAVIGCGAQTATYDDGLVRLVISFEQKGDAFVAKNAACILAALPAKQAGVAKFLLTAFRDIAIGMVQTGELNDIKHNGLRRFLLRVAEGEIDVGK